MHTPASKHSVLFILQIIPFTSRTTEVGLVSTFYTSKVRCYICLTAEVSQNLAEYDSTCIAGGAAVRGTGVALREARGVVRQHQGAKKKRALEWTKPQEVMLLPVPRIGPR